MENLYQQGDVLIKKIKHIPQEANQRKDLVLAHGESGHIHQILDKNKASLLEYGGITYLKVTSPVELVHEEHKMLIIQPGSYEIDQVKEYDPFEEEIRRVDD